MILSRTVAQPNSRLRETDSPNLLNNPNSWAIAIGAQSVSGTKPSRSALAMGDRKTGRVLFIISGLSQSLSGKLAVRVPLWQLGAMNAPRNTHANDERYSWMKEKLDSRQLRAFA